MSDEHDQTGESELTRQDYAALGLRPGAAKDEIERNFRQRRAVFVKAGLATYGLMSDEERIERLRELDAAHSRITRRPRPVNAPADLVEEADDGPAPEPSQDAPARVAPKLPPADFERPGAYLETRRGVLGIDLPTLAAQTRIRKTHLESIEQERFDQLPPGPYIRGFYLQYARALGVKDDAEDLAAAFVRHYRAATSD